MQYGWICPRCGRVNAPWLPFCDCKKNVKTATNSSFENDKCEECGEHKIQKQDNIEFKDLGNRFKP